MNLVLCGMMGAGKSSVGREIAAMLHRRWADTDALIEERYGKIAEIFSSRGEEYFRELETELTRELSKETGVVISTGGGLLIRRENRELLKERGKIVFLRASCKTLLQRLSLEDERPLLAGKDRAERIEKILKVRTPIYEAAASETVDTDEKTVLEVAKEVIKLTEDYL